MMGFGMGFGLVGLLLMFLFVGGLILLAVWAVKAIFVNSSSSQSSTPESSSHSTAQEILDQRYARGEITRQQYELMKQDIG